MNFFDVLPDFSKAFVKLASVFLEDGFLLDLVVEVFFELSDVGSFLIIERFFFLFGFFYLGVLEF